MRNRFISLIVAILATTALWAYDFTDGDFCYRIINDHSVAVTRSEDGIGSNLVHANIPASVTHNGTTYDVTAIDANAFVSYYTGIISITIPKSINSIAGTNSFNGLYRLSSIVVDSENTTYDSRNNCNAIIETATNTLIYGREKSTIPDGIVHIGDGALGGCDLESIDLPSTLQSIGDGAFFNTKLHSIRIPENVKSIGGSAFGGWDQYTGCFQMAVLTPHTPPARTEAQEPPFYGSPTVIVHKEDAAAYRAAGYTNVTPYGLLVSNPQSTQTTFSGDIEFVTLEDNALQKLTCLLDGEQIAESTSNTLHIACTGLTPNKRYTITMRAELKGSDGSTPEVITKDYNFTTQGISISLSSPQQTQKTIGLRMEYNIGDASNERINGFQYCIGSYFEGNHTTVALNKKDVSAPVETTLTGLQPNTTYCVRAYMVFNEKDTVYSRTITVSTKAVATTATITRLTQTKVGVSMQYDWGEIDNIEQYGYEIVGTSIADTIKATGTQSEVLTIDTTFAGLAPNTNYTLRTFIETRDSTNAIFSDDFSKGIGDWRDGSSYYSWFKSVDGACAYSGYPWSPVYGTLSHNVSLTAGIEYTLRVLVKKAMASGANIPNVAITVGDSTIVARETLSTEYEELSGVFTPATDGDYRIGLYVYMNDDAEVADTVYFDDFAVLLPASMGKMPTTISNEQTFKTLPVTASVSCNSQTQSTLSLSGNYDCGDATNKGNGIQYCKSSSLGEYTTVAINKPGSAAQIEATLTELLPNTTYCVRAYVVTAEGDTTYSDVINCTTEAITISTTSTSRTQTKLGVRFTYNWGNANIVEKYGYALIGTSIADTLLSTGAETEPLEIDTIFSGLAPDAEYTFHTFIETRDSVPVVVLSEDFSNGYRAWVEQNTSYGQWGWNNDQKACTFTGTYSYSEGSGWLFTSVNLIGGAKCTFRVRVKKSYSSSSYTTGMAIGIGKGANASSMTRIVSKETFSTEYEEVIGTFTPTESGIYFVGLYGCATKSNPIYFDDFSVTSCVTHIGDNQTFRTLPIYVGITDATTTQTTLAARLQYNWGDMDVENYGYEVEGTSVSDTIPATGAISDTINIDKLVTGLKPNTEYTLRAFVETRDSVPATALSEDFSNGISEWEKQNNSSGEWSCYQSECRFKGQKHYTAYGWLFHSVNLIGGIEYTVRILVRKESSSSIYTVPSMAIGIGRSANSSSMTTIVSKRTIDTKYEEVVGTFTLAESGTYYVGLYGYMKDPGPASYANTIYFDDFSVTSPVLGNVPVYIRSERTLKTLPVTVNVSCTNQTQTTLTLLSNYDCGNSTNTGNGIQWCLGTSFGEDYTTVPFNKTDSVAQMDTTLRGLQPNTTYCARAYVVTAETDTVFSDVITCTTQAITTTTMSATRTQTKLGVSFQYDWGDADNVTRYGYGMFTQSGFETVKTIAKDTISATGTLSDTIKIDTLVTGLTPNTEYTFLTFVETRDSVSATALSDDFSHGLSEWKQQTNSYGKWGYYSYGGWCYFSNDKVNREATGWLFHSVNLIGGAEYTFRVQVKKAYSSDSYTPGMAIGIGAGANSSAMTTIVTKETLSSTEYEEVVGTFTPTESGIYYVGLYGQMKYSYPATKTNSIYFKDFSVSSPVLGKVPKYTYIRGEQKYRTLPVSVSISSSKQTQTTLSLSSRYDCGDATNTGKNGIQYCEGSSFSNTYKTQTIAFNRTDSAARLDTIITGLKHNTQYSMRAYVQTAEGNWAYSEVETYKTQNVDFTFRLTKYTQTKATCYTIYKAGDLTLVNSGIQYCEGSSFSADKAQTFYFNSTDPVLTMDTTITGLKPNTRYTFCAFVETQDEKIYSTTRTITTEAASVSDPTLTQYGQTYMILSTSCNYGDATFVDEAVEYGTSKYSGDLQTASVSNNMVKINNLLPDTRYYYRSLLTTAEGGTIYSDWQEMTTKAITLSTGEADGISAKSVFLHGTIDCDMESRTEIGFEWKRSDAPATVKPQRVLVTDRADSTLVFRLEGLSKDKYYDYRAFCLYKEQTYYGKADDGREWVTFLTADEDVLVAPSVQTLGAETSESGVVLSGFVVAGTENIIQKGFESWRTGTTDVATTVSEGAVMTNEIPEPWSYTTYQYRAYAKTPSGTTYGETKEVTTGYIHKEITDVVVTPSATTATVTWTIVEQADYYILTLFGNAEMTDTLATYTVDEAGNITQRRAPAALRALVNCSIDQLTPDTDYFFTVIAYNSDEKKVAEENGSFTTQLTTDIDNISDNEGDSDTTNHNGNLVRKVFRNGQVLILRGGKTYTLTGVEVK